MKKSIIVLLLMLFAISEVYGRGKKKKEEAEVLIYPKVFLGASAMIGVSAPDFSYGAGVRMHYYSIEKWAGLCVLLRETFFPVKKNKSSYLASFLTSLLQNL